LSFKYIGGGLKNESGSNNLDFFEIAGEDANYVSAVATIEKNKVVVQSQEVTSPVYVRYLFRKPKPKISLINADGLPPYSFITDDLKPPRTSKHAPTPDKAN